MGGDYWIISSFFEFQPDWSKKCAKSRILNMIGMIREYKWRQKISCVRFAENDISNYDLILNTHGARDQKIIKIKKFIFFYIV